jgi:monoamine oxidase
MLRSLINLAREARIAKRRGLSLEALREERALAEERAGRPLTRRALLLGAAGAAGALAAGCSGTGQSGQSPSAGSAQPAGSGGQAPSAGSKKQPKIVIVGAGIAGLSAALELSDKGVACSVYEASGRTGGRMFSNSTYFDDGQVFEWYGELIDTPHFAMLALAKRFDIVIDNLVQAQPPGSRETYHFFGKHYPREDAEKDVMAMESVFRQDIKLAGEDTLYDRTTPYGRELDNMSVYDWIEKRVPGGHASPLGMLLETAYFIELNVDTREQSALNIVYAFGNQSHWAHFDMYGFSDECMKTRGGNQRITDAIAAHLPPGTLNLGMRMESIVQRSSGDYELSFRRANTSQTVVADAVLLTLPFAVLRDLDYKRAGFDALKDKAIQELGRGRQSKQHLQFNRRVWNEKLGRPYPGTGTSYSDQGYQVTWEATRAQPGPKGILVAYCGGRYADAMSTKVAVATAKIESVQMDAKRFLTQVEPVFPGLSAQFNGKCAHGLPHLDPNYNCSYSHWRIGQYQSFRGYERAPQGHVFFAGEHTSTDFQGFMEGGAAEGQRAAKEILKAFSL